jgi:hypothetical protein
MSTKKVIQCLAVALIIFATISCKKECNKLTSDSLIGKWVSNKNDTIRFFKRNNITLTDAASGSPGPDSREIEFAYSSNKLYLKDGASITGEELRKLETFNWVEDGQKFNVESRDIFSYRSSNAIPLVFTKQ